MDRNSDVCAVHSPPYSEQKMDHGHGKRKIYSDKSDTDGAGDSSVDTYAWIHGKRHPALGEYFQSGKDSWHSNAGNTGPHVLRILGLCMYFASSGYTLEHDSCYGGKIV